MDSEDRSAKAHRKRQAGTKFNKKQNKKSKLSDSHEDRRARNPKAFAVQHVNKTARMVRRTLDVETAKQHIPMDKREMTEPPPVVVAIVGPKGVGKSLLLQCLVKNYSKQKLSQVNGPITVVSGKRKRLTFIEVNQDINCIVDVAKVADLVLLMVNAQDGWDMTIFEFINICQIHGFPKIIGVLNHLDDFKDSKSLKKFKKRLKHRFWQEVYQGAKLFYLTKIINQEYLKTEIHNLGRFISVMKFRPLQWRTSHPYLLVDRFEDITDLEAVRKNEKCDRNVVMYGYVRGTHLRNCTDIHIPGCGDFVITDMGNLPDPCPFPDTQKKRSLNLRERNLYAPMSGVGGMLLDKDAIYIHTGGSHHFNKESSAQSLVASAVDYQLEEDHSIRLTSDGASFLAKNIQRIGDDVVTRAEEEIGSDDNESESSGIGSDSEMEVDDDSDGEIGDDDNLMMTASLSNEEQVDEVKTRFQELAAQWKPVDTNRVNWSRLVYGKANKKRLDEADEAFEIEGLLRSVQKVSVRTEDDEEDRSLPQFQGVRDWSEGLFDLIRDCFVTGEWDESEDAAVLLKKDSELRGAIDDSDSDPGPNSDQESEEEEEKEQAASWQDELKEKQLKKHSTRAEKIKALRDKNKLKKEKLKAAFDAEYDAAKSSAMSGGKEEFLTNWKAEIEQQSRLNREEFADMDEEVRVQMEGFRPGMYVRVELTNMPCELSTHFDPSYPLIVGGLLPGESATGLMKLRFKHHRWFKKILKAKDPLVFSAGWRRFQSIPVYSIEEHNGRHRYLKYTPEHQHCDATIFGPILAQNSGILAVQSVAGMTREFRIAGSGTVLDKDHSIPIMKKLKLVGRPFKIFKKTAFLKGMFNTKLEVAKFIGAKVQTVSGIRGMIKKSLTDFEGACRATFEDRILMSDIVFCRCWAQVEVPAYYNPVMTLLLDSEARLRWQGLRCLAQVRKEAGLSHPGVHPDSQYVKGEPIRKQIISLPVKLPKALQRDLPYKFKPKTLRKQEDAIEKARPVVVREPNETRRAQLLDMLKTVHAAHQDKKHQAMVSRVTAHKAAMKKIDASRQVKQKQTKKILFARRQQKTDKEAAKKTRGKKRT